MKKITLAALTALLMLGCPAQFPAGQLETADPAAIDEAAAEKQIDGLYQTFENDLYRTEFPDGWKLSSFEQTVFAEKDNQTLPNMAISAGDLTDIDEQLDTYVDLFKENFGEKLVGEPERITYEVEGTSRELSGLSFFYSSDDGVEVISTHLYLEELGGQLFCYTCDYIASTSDPQHHEDETTIFAFMHAIDTLELL